MDMITIFEHCGLLLLAYMLGSIPWGRVITAIFTSKDIRKIGSGNIGATNVRRVAGVKLGALTLFLDAAKGALPVAAAAYMTHGAGDTEGQLFVALVGLAAVCGHLFPVYTGFRWGGKGVATAWGCFVIVSPVSAIITLLVFVMMICLTNKASVGSLSGAAVLPFVVWKATHSWMFAASAVLIAGLIFLRHRENILRIINGTESNVWKK